MLTELELPVTPNVSVVARVFGVISAETCGEFRDVGNNDIPIPDDGRLPESESNV
jgi:hypothetical protein